MRLLSILATILFLTPGISPAQQDVQITSEHVAGSVHMLVGQGGNIGATAGSDGILIVDDQFAPLAEKIRAALKEIDPGPLRFILNTHYHGDHTGGNEILGREGTIIAHSNVRKRLSTEQQLLGRTQPAAPPGAWPVITFDQSVSIHFNGEEIHVLHFPSGHTDGDSIIFFKGSNVIHMGDHFFRDRFPFVDLGAGGSVQGLTDNIASVIKMAPEGVKIIPGHGVLSGVEDLERYHEMLVETTEMVASAKREGKTLEEVQAQGVPEKYSSWGSGFINNDRWLEIVFNSLG